MAMSAPGRAAFGANMTLSWTPSWFLLSGVRFQVSAFQLFASYPGVRSESGHGEKLVAGLCYTVFHSQPVEQRALILLLAGRDSDQRPEEMGNAVRNGVKTVGRRFFVCDGANLWSDPCFRRLLTLRGSKCHLLSCEPDFAVG
jgi:hypothetical protein